MKTSNRSRKRSRLKKSTAIIVVVAIIAVAILLVLELSGVIHFFNKAQTTTPISGSSATKGEIPQTRQQNQSQGKSSNNTNGSESKNTNGSSASLLIPTGNFVSNHYPNLSGYPAPNTIASVCTTTPGANCYITFTKDSVTKSLPSKTTDTGGSAYWNWKLQDLSLTTGPWQVQAIATLDGQTKTAKDVLSLEVSP